MKNRILNHWKAIAFLILFLCGNNISYATDLVVSYCGTLLHSGTYTYNNVIISTGGCLQIEPGTNITVNGKIVVNNGANLYIDGTTMSFNGTLMGLIF